MRSLLVVAFVAAPLAAADPAPATVSGAGTVEIKRPAETLRVQFDVMARGKNLAEATDKLKARRAAVTAELVKLGAAKDAVTAGDIDLVDEASERSAQIDRLMLNRAKALGKTPKAKADAPTVLVVPLKADFPLPADKPDELLIATKTLQEKVRAADLGGLKADGKATPEEEEQAEEAVGRPGRGDDAPRGAPTFLFVFKVTEAERTKALAEAFAQARQDAKRLATAAGQDLGELYKLADQSQPSADADDVAMLLRREYGYGRFNGGGGMLVGNEAVGTSPGKLAVKVGVSAQFKLAPPK